MKEKDKIIKTFSTKLQSHGFSCKQTEEDADTDIIMTSIKIATNNKTVVVVDQDIGILIL